MEDLERKYKILSAVSNEKLNEFRDKIRENNYYCPCQIPLRPETRCFCKKFLERDEEGKCICGIYTKVLRTPKELEAWDKPSSFTKS